MTLYIRFGYLSQFDRLYDANEDMQLVIERRTGIKWKINDIEFINEIESILGANNIKFDIEWSFGN